MKKHLIIVALVGLLGLLGVLIDSRIKQNQVEEVSFGHFENLEDYFESYYMGQPIYKIVVPEGEIRTGYADVVIVKLASGKYLAYGFELPIVDPDVLQRKIFNVTMWGRADLRQYDDLDQYLFSPVWFRPSLK